MKSLSVLNKLKEQHLKIAFAESMTGGRAASELVRHPGASNVFELGIICYSADVKEEILGISKDVIHIHGVVSKAVSMEMAHNVLLKAYANIGVGITGSAGPTKEVGSDVGEVWVTIYLRENYHSYHFKFGALDREEIITKTVKAIYHLLDQLL